MQAGSSTVAIQLASEAEIADDQTVSRLVKQGQDGRFLVFRPQQQLPTDTDISVVLEAGTPSAEGPRLTTEEQSFSFRTYAPLRIVRQRCGWYEEECPPFQPFIIEFNNPIDRDNYNETLLQINPDLQGANVQIFGNQVEIKGGDAGTHHLSRAGQRRDSGYLRPDAG